MMKGGVSSEAGVLNLSCAMEPFESLVKLTGHFSEKCIYMNKTQAVRFIAVNRHLWRLNTINYFVTYIHLMTS
jgi:hypothetical protein